MLSITYFCRDNSSSGSDSSIQASLRRSKRAEGGQAQKGKLGSAVLERGTSQSPFPWAVVFTVQSGHSGLPSGQIGPREIQ